MNCIDLKRSVIDSGLCCGCGACFGVCPAEALTIDITRSHEPIIDESKCTECGLCFDVCPGRGYDIAVPSRDRSDEGALFIPERGPVIECLAGHSTDPEIRLHSASGGVATSLLIHLLESRQVDSVLVVGMENERPAARLTHEIMEIKDSSGSKYGPVPLLACLIRELMKRPQRIAATFTPCQLAGWRKAAESIPRLRESTVTAVGFFCGYIQTYDAIKGVASTLGLEYPDEATFTHWRYGPYPGNIRFERRDGSSVEKPLYDWLDIAVPHYSLKRCFLCPDGGNWLADMTLGDIHSGGEDETVIVCRTGRGRAALDSARNAGSIVTRELRPEQIEQSVIRHITRSKLLPALARISWLDRKGRPAPEFDYNIPSLLRYGKKSMSAIQVMKYRLTFWLRKNRPRRFLLRHPPLLERTGHFLYNLPSSLPGWKLMIRARGLLRR